MERSQKITCPFFLIESDNKGRADTGTQQVELKKNHGVGRSNKGDYEEIGCGCLELGRFSHSSQSNTEQGPT